MRVTILSSLAQDSGCWLRASYLSYSLQNYCEVTLIKPFKKSLPFMLDLFLSIFFNTFSLLFKKSDYIIAIKPFPNVTIPLLIKKYIGNCRIVVDIDDIDSGYRKGLLSKINSFVQKPFPKYFDIVTYHNSLLKDYIAKEFGVDPGRLYNLDQGVDINIFDSRIYDYKLRNNFSNKKIVLYVGHLNIASDLDMILEAMKIVHGSYDNMVFIVAGGGPDEGDFKKLARELKVDAIFTSQISKEDIVKYISIADLCLVYYKDKTVNYYRCSMKLRECLAMGKKIVCNDVGDLKNFEKYTYQTSSDINQYAKEIISLLESGGDGREVKGMEFIRENLSWHDIGKKFAKILV